jgi:hypothetical protein
MGRLDVALVDLDRFLELPPALIDARDVGIEGSYGLKVGDGAADLSRPLPRFQRAAQLTAIKVDVPDGSEGVGLLSEIARRDLKRKSLLEGLERLTVILPSQIDLAEALQNETLLGLASDITPDL